MVNLAMVLLSGYFAVKAAATHLRVFALEAAISSCLRRELGLADMQRKS
jgi:hypothetical protein